LVEVEHVDVQVGVGYQFLLVDIKLKGQKVPRRPCGGDVRHGDCIQ